MSTGRKIARIFAVLTILLFVLLFPGLLLAYDAQAVATNPDFLEAVISDTRLLEASYTEIADDLAREVSLNSDTRDTPAARLTAQDWEDILVILFPPGDLERWAQESLESFRRWTGGRGTFFEGIILPFSELRANLVEDPEQRVIRILTEAQPSCVAGEKPLVGPDDLLPTCRPVGTDLELFYQGLSRRWQEQTPQTWQQLFPESAEIYGEDLSLAELIELQSGQSWREVRFSMRTASWALGLARGLLLLVIIGGAIATLAVIALLAARNLPEVLRWVGGPTLLAGLFTLGWGLLILISGWFGPVWYDYGPEVVSLEMQAALDEISRIFAGRLFASLVWQGVLMALVGAVLWGPSFLMRKPQPAAPAQPEEPPSE